MLAAAVTAYRSQAAASSCIGISPPIDISAPMFLTAVPRTGMQPTVHHSIAEMPLSCTSDIPGEAAQAANVGLYMSYETSNFLNRNVVSFGTAHQNAALPGRRPSFSTSVTKCVTKISGRNRALVEPAQTPRRMCAKTIAWAIKKKAPVLSAQAPRVGVHRCHADTRMDELEGRAIPRDETERHGDDQSSMPNVFHARTKRSPIRVSFAANYATGIASAWSQSRPSPRCTGRVPTNARSTNKTPQ